MRIKRLVTIVLVVVLAVVAGVVFPKKQYPLKTRVQNAVSGVSPESMTFEVSVPANTPVGDTVWIYVWQGPHQMLRKSGNIYTISLSPDQLAVSGSPPLPGEPIRYRYSRNGYNFRTAEYLAPTVEEPDRDTNDYFWTKQGREVDYQPGKVQRDTIERWRWFPERGIPPTTANLEPDGQFLPRVNNVPFRSGQTIEDLYDPSFRDFFDSTAKHISKLGYTWVEIDPPWQWTEERGLPKTVNDFANNPNYPDDETFLEEVRAYKKQGLRVLISPQVCCVDTVNKSDKWWRAYFDETEKFLTHFAQLAEQSKTNAFGYAITPQAQYPKSIVLDSEWRRIFASIRKVFSGEVGEMVWILGPEVSASPKSIPDSQFVTWGDTLDFFLIATEFPLSTKSNPSDEELAKGAGRVVDGAKEFNDRFNKPVIVRNGYFNVKNSWKGQSFYQIGSVPWIDGSEAKLKESIYQFDTVDLARVVNAYFKAIAARPWVIGYFHFGYTHWEDPLSPWMSIRGKPAEDIWSRWNDVIFK